MPFVTDYLWRELYSPKGVHYETLSDEELEYPEGDADLIRELARINSAVWKYKKENNIRFSQPLQGTLYIPESATPIAEDIAKLHKVQKVVAGEPDTTEEVIKLDEGIFLRLEQ